jgi:hypothetical protein
MKRKTNSRAARAVREPVATQDSQGHLKRINALLKWWGAPPIDFSANESQLHCLHQFTDGVQTLYRDVSSRQRQMLQKAGQDINEGVARLSWPRKPYEVLGVQSAIAAKLLDGMSRQSHLWTDVAEGFIDCYAAFAKGTAEICHCGKRDAHDKKISLASRSS